VGVEKEGKGTNGTVSDSDPTLSTLALNPTPAQQQWFSDVGFVVVLVGWDWFLLRGDGNVEGRIVESTTQERSEMGSNIQYQKRKRNRVKFARWV